MGHASVGADYLKIRAALESYPIDPYLQINELFVKRAKGNIRAMKTPPLSVCHAHAHITGTMLGLEE